jgi:putative phage-type endonuclease
MTTTKKEIKNINKFIKIKDDFTCDLIDVTSIIKPDNVSYLNHEEMFELYDTCIYLIDDFITSNNTSTIDEEFNEILHENVFTLINILFEDDIFYNDDAEEEIEYIIQQAKDDYFKYHIQHQNINLDLDLENEDNQKQNITNQKQNITNQNISLENEKHNFNNVILSLKIHNARNKYQPVQRTKEWYEFRHNLITASNAYKAFENQTVQNQLIYEKCKPLNDKLFLNENENENTNNINTNNTNTNNTNTIKEIVMVNVNSTLHWGQKYEPLSVLIYEDKYNTKIEDFGCIQHDIYSFIGASPDGINVKLGNERYGRMLEIKNIVNREINGIPKKEYWVQMQLQMEVCDLNECDFLETKFVEYENQEEYVQDKNKANFQTGQIMYFHNTKEGKPFYLYKPLNIVAESDINKWFEESIEKYESEKYNYTFIRIIYWKLQVFSCILVYRNKEWFKENVKYLEAIWDIILKERESGFDHRKPKPRISKKKDIDIGIENKCLILQKTR